MKLRNKKTGYVGDFNIECIKERGDYVKVVANDAPYYEIKKECGNLYYYDTLAEFNEEWEDYKPAEPLIKEESARAIVKSWYMKNRLVGKLQSYGGDLWLGLRGSDEDDGDWKIELHVRYYSTLKDDELYSLTELIGEEEE